MEKPKIINTSLDSILPAIFGPLGKDMAAVTAKYSKAELRAIADFLHQTRQVLLVNTERFSQTFGID